MRLAFLTGGGDVPELNFCIKAVVMRAAANGWDVLGFRLCLGLAAAFNPDYDSP